VSFRETNKTNAPPNRRTCGNCGALGHLSRTCTSPTTSVDKLGIEIEGWWNELPRAAAIGFGAAGVSDASLAHHETARSHEYRTAPGSLAEQVSQLIALYPDFTHESAGMHVHLSFGDPLDVTALASDVFLDYFLSRWRSWGERNQLDRSGEFWKRLNGHNQYCQITNATNVENECTGVCDRYRQVNFSSYSRHRTVEQRLLPLFRDLRLAILAVEETQSIFSEYLSRIYPAAPLRHDVDVIAPPTEVFGPPEEREITLAMEPETSECPRREIDANLIAVDPVPVNHVRVWGGAGNVAVHVINAIGS
jgi:hypothetical protein